MKRPADYTPIPIEKMILAQSDVHTHVGPQAKEVFAVCGPDPSPEADAAAQSASLYRKLRGVLSSEGGSPKHVVQEFLFFRDIRRDLTAFQRGRHEIVGRLRGPTFYLPASTLLQQPPLDPDHRVELAFHAVIPHRRQTERPRALRFPAACDCRECTLPSVRESRLDKVLHLRAGNIYGAAGSSYDEAFSMYRSAERILQQHGMTFRHVARTWIHLRNIQRDYAEFNRARRDFYRLAGITLLPASTGIEGSPFPEAHNFLLSFYAIKSTPQPEFQAMTTPTLNEACTYGSDFSRGIRVADGNKETLLVSGTASVDEEGLTAHPGDVRAQVNRMLLNISTLLAGRGASLLNVASFITYLKDPADAVCLREVLRERGFDGTPNVLVQAAVCRPDLLCEMEALAILPL